METPQSIDNNALTDSGVPVTSDAWRDYVCEKILAQAMRMDALEKKLDVAAATANAWHDYVCDKFLAQATRMDALEKKLDVAAATAERVELATADVVSTLASWNGAMQVIESIGKILKPVTYIVGFCTALVGLWIAVKHGFYKDN